MELKKICQYLYLLDKKRLQDENLFEADINTDCKNNTNCSPTVRNIILNKYLHLLQIFSLIENKKKIFSEDIICFLNGGVVIKAWKNCSNWFNEINENNESKLKKEIETKYKDQTKIIKKFVNIFKDVEPYRLIEISHSDPAWIKAYSKIKKLKTKNKMNLENFINEYNEIYSNIWWE